jgi:hypothetical protein
LGSAFPAKYNEYNNKGGDKKVSGCTTATKMLYPDPAARPLGL